MHVLPEVADYVATRNLPSVEGTSRLSPYLHFGEISPATVWHMASKQAHAKAGPFLRELAWRDFALGQVQQFPRLGEETGRGPLDGFSWCRKRDVVGKSVADGLNTGGPRFIQKKN